MRERQAHAGPFRRECLRQVIPWLALLAQGLVVALLYMPVTRSAFVSDDWVWLESSRRGFWHAVTAPIGYHYAPVANVLFLGAYRLFGAAAARYRLTLLACHVAVGHLAFRLGLRLGVKWPAALCASLLFLGSASFHEVTFWTGTGNVFTWAAILFLLGLGEAIGMIEDGRVSVRRWRLAFWFFVALLAYPATFTLLPVAAITLVWGQGRKASTEGRSPEHSSWRWIVRALAPCLLVCAVLIPARLHFAAATAGEASLRMNSERFYWIVRGIMMTFSLRGSHDVVQRWLSLGATDLYGSHVGVLGCALLWIALGAWCCWRRPWSVTTLLAAWISVHFALAGLSVNIASRHTYLAAIPATLIIGSALLSIGERISQRIHRSGVSAVVRYAPLTLGTLVLMAGAHRDLRTATRVWTRAFEANRRTQEDIGSALSAHRLPATLTLVNLPNIFADGGIGAYAFTNGAPDMVRFSFGGQVSEADVRSVGVLEPSNVAWDSRPTSISELARASRDPSRIVLAFDPASLGVRPWTFAPSDRYTLQTAPFLEWRPGAWPWLLIPSGAALELPLRTNGEAPWVAVRYAGRPGTHFRMTFASGSTVTVEPPPTSGRWVTSTWPMGRAPESNNALTLLADSDLWVAHIWAFAPLSRYQVDTSPFLPWVEGAQCFPIDGETRLPLSRSENGTGAVVEIEYLAEKGRTLSVSVEGGPPRVLEVSEPAAWRTAHIPVASAPLVTLTLTQTETLVPMVRSIVLAAKARPAVQD